MVAVEEDEVLENFLLAPNILIADLFESFGVRVSSLWLLQDLELFPEEDDTIVHEFFEVSFF